MRRETPFRIRNKAKIRKQREANKRLEIRNRKPTT